MYYGLVWIAALPRRASPPLELTRMASIGQRLALIAIAAGALLAASCGDGGPPPEEVSPYFPVTVARADGKELTFERPAQRIVSLSPGHTEVLFAIGAGDQVIAEDSEANFPPETEGKTRFDAQSPDVEALEGLEPDLVVVMAGPEEVVKSLDQRGLQVLWLAVPDSVSGLLDQIDMLGEITGRVEESDALVDSIDSRFISVFDTVGATAGPRVYHELDDELTTTSSSTFIGELYLILNGISIADDPEEPYPQLALDAIVQADPEVIIVAHAGASPESVKARPGWQNISAVKNDRVYAVDPDTVNRPGPRLVDGLETLAKLLHPDLFPEP